MRRTAWRVAWAVAAVAAWWALGSAAAVAQEAAAPPVVDLRGDGVRVVAHDASHRALAERVVAMFGETHAVVRLRLGRGVEGETRIALAAIRGGGHHPPTAVGLARWSSRSIIIDPYRLGVTAPLQSVLAHEISHLVVGQASQGGAPAWFDEGVAEWIGAAYGLTDRRAFLQAKLPHLKDLESGFPHEPAESRIAYAASRETIDIITTRVGGDAVAEILRNLAKGQPFREAVRRATGKGPGDWDVALHAHQAEKPSRLRQMFESNPALVWILVFAVMGLVSVYAAIVRKRIAQAKLDAAEPPDVTIPDTLPPLIDADAAMLEHEAEYSEPEGEEGLWEPGEDDDDDDDESWRGDIH